MGQADLKVVLLGAVYSGKTSLLERYLNDTFTSEVPYRTTIGAAFGVTKFEINGRSVKMGIWDTGGSEKFESITPFYYRGAKAAIICFDPTERTSFERGQFWINQLKIEEENCRVYLCQTKKDITDSDSLLRQIDSVTAQKFSSEINSVLFETSSKTGENIKELFYAVARDYVSSNSNATLSDSDCVKLNESKDRQHCCSARAHKTVDI